MNLLSIFAVGGALLTLPFLTSSHPGTPLPKGGKYIGSAQCKNCHDGTDKGDMFSHWAQTEHAKAYETLASDKAKQIAKEKGIADPQKSEKCLSCHVTAYGVDKKELKPTFKMEQGVQCETCHGPGEEHAKKRLAEAMKKPATPTPITAEEIRSERSIETCTKCHNPESPTYKPFCLVERMKVIEHLDPRKKRSEEELKVLRATCTPDCAICKEKGGKGEAEAAGKPDKK